MEINKEYIKRIIIETRNDINAITQKTKDIHTDTDSIGSTVTDCTKHVQHIKMHTVNLKKIIQQIESDEHLRMELNNALKECNTDIKQFYTLIHKTTKDIDAFVNKL
jgi:hypothetical protein